MSKASNLQTSGTNKRYYKFVKRAIIKENYFKEPKNDSGTATVEVGKNQVDNGDGKGDGQCE